ncbi:MAG: helix-turn-helix transcriptional regulator [Chlorobiaceae bacterium]
MTNEKIGHRIKQIRSAKGLSQEDLARQVDLPRTAITKIESGNQNVRFTELEKLATALGISLGDLLEERRPVRESSDLEFFRVSDSCDSPSHAGLDNKLRTVLLTILERGAGDPRMNEHRLVTIVQQADKAFAQAYGETVSGIPCRSPHLRKTISEALALMTSTGELMKIETAEKEPARYLPTVKADLRLLNAAEYLVIEKTNSLAST